VVFFAKTVKRRSFEKCSVQ